MLSVCRTIHLLRKRGPQTSTDNTIGKSSLNVMWNADMRSGQVPYVQCVRKIAPKPMVPDASVYRCNVGVVNHGWASIKLRPLNCSMKIDHACKSRQLLIKGDPMVGFCNIFGQVGVRTARKNNLATED